MGKTEIFNDLLISLYPLANTLLPPAITSCPIPGCSWVSRAKTSGVTTSLLKHVKTEHSLSNLKRAWRCRYCSLIFIELKIRGHLEKCPSAPTLTPTTATDTLTPAMVDAVTFMPPDQPFSLLTLPTPPTLPPLPPSGQSSASATTGGLMSDTQTTSTPQRTLESYLSSSAQLSPLLRRQATPSASSPSILIQPTCISSESFYGLLPM